MNAIQLITASFDDLHQALREDLAGIDDEVWWWQPATDANHIGFLAWHIVRDEDTVLSYLAGEPQLWLSDRWHERFGMDSKAQGTGFAPASLTATRYLRSELTDYAGAVWARTPRLLETLSESRLEQPAWPDSTWTVATQLIEGCLGHSWLHLGEIRATRGLRGWRFRE